MMRDGVYAVLRENGRLPFPVEQLNATDDLFAAGLDSAAAVDVMLALEERFGIEIPERLLTRRAFSSVAALEQLVSEAAAAAA
jgi:acyl carrier protein